MEYFVSSFCLSICSKRDHFKQLPRIFISFGLGRSNSIAFIFLHSSSGFIRSIVFVTAPQTSPTDRRKSCKIFR